MTLRSFTFTKYICLHSLTLTLGEQHFSFWIWGDAFFGTPGNFLSLSFETEIGFCSVSLSRPSSRLKLSEPQARNRVRDHRICQEQDAESRDTMNHIFCCIILFCYRKGNACKKTDHIMFQLLTEHCPFPNTGLADTNINTLANF